MIRSILAVLSVIMGVVAGVGSMIFLNGVWFEYGYYKDLRDGNLLERYIGNFFEGCGSLVVVGFFIFSVIVGLLVIVFFVWVISSVRFPWNRA